MKKQRLEKVPFAVAVMLALTACSAPISSADSSVSSGPENPEFEKIVDFANGTAEGFHLADGYTNGGPFNCYFRKAAGSFEDGKLTLSVYEEEGGTYAGGEYRSYARFSYGYYTTRMKAANCSGVITSFFLYTHWPVWDEIDIEILGKNMNQVQFNYYTNGVGGHEYLHDLGFNASEEFHDYGFRWEEDRVTWFVDDQPVYQVVGDEDTPLPSAPGRIMTNYWPCSAEGWSGKFEGTQGKTSDYLWIKSSADTMYADADKPTEPPAPPTSSIDWDSITPTELTFESNDVYTVSKDGDVTVVSYSDLAGNTYRNVNAHLDGVQAPTSAVSMKIGNSGTETVQVRINMMDYTVAGGKNINTSATMDGVAVRTDLEWGGSFFDVPADSYVVAVVNYEGTPTDIELMIDSARGDATLRSGTVGFGEFKFGYEEASAPAVIDWESIPVTNLAFASNDVYTVSEQEGVTVVTYSDLAGNSYRNVNAHLDGVQAPTSAVAMHIGNNGTETVQVRVNVMDYASGSNCINTSATMDGETVRTDLEWGGSYFDVPADTFVVAIVNYEGTPTDIELMIDSARGDATLRSGTVGFGEFKFGYAQSGETGPLNWDEATAVELSFASNDVYTVSDQEGVTVVTYSDLAGDSYRNVNAHFDAALVSGKRAIAMHIGNDGTETVQVRVNVMDYASGSKCLNTSATMDGESVRTDLEWGGSFFDVPADTFVVAIINFEGVPTDLELMIDSARGDATLRSGTVGFGEFKLA